MQASIRSLIIQTAGDSFQKMKRLPAKLKFIYVGLFVVLFAGLSSMAVRTLIAPDDYRAVFPQRIDLTASVLVSGRVQPDNRVDIKPPIAGRVERILVHEGDTVKKGQILLWMSSYERAAIIDAARVKGPKELAYWEKLNPPTPVIAPVDGLIIQRNVEPAQAFSKDDAILVLSDRFVVEAPMDETDVAKVFAGQEATVSLDAYPDQLLAGRVLRIAHESRTQNNVTVYIMEIEIKDVPDFVRVGLTANVGFELQKKRNALVIPSEALKATETELYVLVGNSRNGKPEKRVIEVGLNDGQNTEVLSGLSDQDVIYVPNQNYLNVKEKTKTKSIFSDMDRPEKETGA